MKSKIFKHLVGGATSDKVSEPTTSQSWCWLCATENSLYLFNSSS